MTRACVLLNISRRRLKYLSTKDDSKLLEQMMETARRHPRWGSRQLCRSLRLGGEVVNLKRVRRICREHGLLIKQKRRRKRRGIGVGMPCRAEHPNHVWAYDFMEDRTEGGRHGGRKLRILTVIDEFTRRCVEVEVEHRMTAKFVGITLLRLFQVHGTPGFIRSDNGSEFIAKFLMNVLKIHGVEARHIDPGSPWQNGMNERFNGTLRDECLNSETFHHRDHARAVIKLFARMYNDERPHGGLGRNARDAITPSGFDQRWKREHEAKDGCAQSDGFTKEDGFAGDEGTGLSLCSPPADGANDKGLTEVIDQPISRKAIHNGAPVAPQQSRTLRVEGNSVTNPKSAEISSVNNPQPSLKT